MAKGSSLPPLKDNQGKYGLLAVLIIFASFGLWFVFGTGGEPNEAPAPAAKPEAILREQFEPKIEIPVELEVEEELAATEPAEAGVQVEKKKRWARTKYQECEGILSAREILGTINGPPRRQVRSCYERRLKDDNLLQGSMDLLLTIASNGSVGDVRVSGTLDDRLVYSCVKRAARSWKFPAPEGGCVRTSMPFVMTPRP